MILARRMSCSGREAMVSTTMYPSIIVIDLRRLISHWSLLSPTMYIDDLYVLPPQNIGGNTSFIRRLESKAVAYTRLSKFEKMDCIKDLINGWDGRFFMVEPGSGSCTVVRDSSPSSKLYTSVRRMMNYVVKKNETSVGGSGVFNKEGQHRSKKKSRSEVQKPVSSRKRKRLATVVTPDSKRVGTFSIGTDESEPMVLDTNIIMELEEEAICTLVRLSSSSLSSSAGGLH